MAINFKDTELPSLHIEPVPGYRDWFIGILLMCHNGTKYSKKRRQQQRNRLFRKLR